MAKRKRKVRQKVGFFDRLFGFFIPSFGLNRQGLAWFLFSRMGVAIGSLFLSLTLIFSILPVPFSAYMVQKKIASFWLDEHYSIHYHWVSSDRIAWQMKMAVIASEDQNFDNHFGIDLHAIEVALKRNTKSKKLRGGSTISQQTVKNLYLWHGPSWLRKGVELPLTFLLECLWDKSRILEVYLNIAEFGYGIFGVEAAAQYYFHKHASQLTLEESALLAASLPNPLVFKVNHPSSIMKKRQAWIMRQVQNLGGQEYLGKL